MPADGGPGGDRASGRFQYLGMTYACNGAVSGGWWDGPCQESNNGYGLVRFYNGGSLENEYVEFGWTPQA